MTRVLLGIGNPFKGDDGFGPRVAELMADAPDWRAWDCGPMPENFAGRIAKLRPELVVLVDAAGMGLAPGELRRLASGTMSGFALSTHSMPLSLLMARLAEAAAEVVLIGAEPVEVALGEGLSPPVAAAAERLARLLRTGRWREITEL